VLRFLRRLLKLGFLAGAGYAIWRYLERRRDESGVEWEPQPFPYPPQPRADMPTTGEPTGGAEPIGGAEATGSAPGATVTKAAETGPAPLAAERPWVEPVDGTCPVTHPIKAKMSSHIFHVPGGANYERTHADRCYRDAAAAERDGLRQSSR